MLEPTLSLTTGDAGVIGGHEGRAFEVKHSTKTIARVSNYYSAPPILMQMSGPPFILLPGLAGVINQVGGNYRENLKPCEVPMCVIEGIWKAMLRAELALPTYSQWEAGRDGKE